MICHLGIEYTESEKKGMDGYKGVQVRYLGSRGRMQRKLFNSGDPASDFANANLGLRPQGGPGSDDVEFL